MFWMKVHGGKVLAACDRELLGKTFREGEVVLYIKETYYKGDLVDSHTLLAAIETYPIVGLVGERAVTLAVEAGYASWEFVKRVKEVPHINIYKL